MLDINTLAPALGILCDAQSADGFKHIATAWHLGDGDWVSAWPSGKDVPSSVELLTVRGKHVSSITDSELENGVIGFNAFKAEASLTVAKDVELNKRDCLSVVGYPSVIDHPAFSLHRGSLSAERYYPYLCPWILEGHLALFSADDGYVTGQFYHGMQGAPVLNAQAQVVGLLLDGTEDAKVPPLARFRRLA